METTEKTNEILNDLILINNDRIAGFEKAGGDLDEKNRRLKIVFNRLADQSRSYVNQLSGLARENGVEPEEGTTAAGSLHRAWLEIKATFTGNDLGDILEECHRGEHAIAAAYKSVLAQPNEISPELYQLLIFQQNGIQEGHDMVRSLGEQTASGENYRAAEMEQENTAELQPGYEKQNIPGMEPPDHFESFRKTDGASQ